MNRKQRKHSKMLEVRIFSVALAYGGPEEGGWWYPQGSLLRYVSKATFFNRAKARELADSLQASIPQPRFPLHSAAPGAGEYQVRIVSFDSPDFFPVVRPHYE